MKKIAVLGADDNLRPFYRQAKALGYSIVGIAWAEGATCKDFCDTFYPVNFAQKEEVLEICKKEQINGIISFCLESALPTLTYVVQEMGLVGNSYECLHLTQTKFAQREALEHAGIPVPGYYLVKNEEQLSDIHLRYPIIVKPVDAGGSQGICKVEAPEQLLEAFHIAAQRSHCGDVIVEEFVDGREFSVEFISHQGKHYLLQITDKETSGAPRFVEVAHHQPAELSDDVWERIRDMVSKALTALHVENSASHTEIKLNSRGELFIIETGARMGGDYITSDLVRLSTGYDFVKGAIDLAVGDFTEPVLDKKFHSGIYFYSMLHPEVRPVIEQHEQYPEIVEWELSTHPLTEVRSNADRGGYFIYQTKNERFNPFGK
ncbi:MAG: ATP-grasp domain-containing protein [Bacteroidaceae bacterium]|nr:ATP-grasp domain-containing protein [Bacteroidaceae bacterium]